MPLKIFIALTFLAGLSFLVFLLNIFFNFSPVELIKCINLKGSYKFLNEPIFSHMFYCDVEFPDAGKQCTKSSECHGSCLVTEDTKTEFDTQSFTTKVLGGFGECSKNSTPSLCSEETMENPNRICF